MTPYGAELVETVARAIYADSYTNYGTCSPEHWAKTSEVQRAFCRGQARAALAATFAALQTPSEDVMRAGRDATYRLGNLTTAENAWTAMLAQVQREIGE